MDVTAPPIPADDKTALANTAGGNGALGRALTHASDTRFRGDIAEVIVFTKALTPAQQSAIETYAKWHWGFTF